MKKLCILTLLLLLPGIYAQAVYAECRAGWTHDVGFAFTGGNSESRDNPDNPDFVTQERDYSDSGFVVSGEHCVLNSANYDLYVGWGLQSSRATFTDTRADNGNRVSQGSAAGTGTSLGIGFRW